MKKYKMLIGNRDVLISILFILFSFILIVNIQQYNAPEGLDPSWNQSYNYFMENGLKFGEEVVFTYGPAAPLFLDSFSGELYWAKVGADIFIALISAIIIWLIARKAGWVPAILLTIANMYCYGRDPYYFALQLTCLFLVIFYENKTNERQKTILISASVLVIAIISYIKFTFFVTGAFVVLLIALYFFVNKQKKQGFITLITLILSVILYWLIFNQSMMDLFKYIFYSLQISLGYTPAMAVVGPVSSIFAALILAVICGVLAVSPIIRYYNSNRAMLIIIVSLLGVGFILWKEGFVRHDLHMLAFFQYFMYVSAFLWCIHNDRGEKTFENEYWLNLIQKIALLFIFVIPLMFSSKLLYDNYFDKRIVTDKVHKVTQHIKYFLNPASIWSQKAILEEQKENIKRESPNAVLVDYVGNETIDIYNYNQNKLHHVDLNWSPRPVFQSYSAYTRRLLKINESHIINKGPKFVLFNNETIDGRLPLLDDNLWVRQLFHRYSFVANIHGQLLLERKEGVVVPELRELGSGTIGFNQEVAIPDKGNPIYISVKMEETLLGKIVSLLYKPPVINMVVYMKNGSSYSYRIIPEMIEEPTLISPMLNSNQKVLNFLYGMSTDIVDRIKIVVSDPLHYKSNIKIKIYEDSWPQNFTISEFINIEPSKIVYSIPLEIRFVYGKKTLYFHPDAEMHFFVEGRRVAQAIIGLMPEVKTDQKSDGVNIYWEAERNGNWEQFGRLEYNAQMFGEDFVTLTAEIPEGISKIRLRIDGGNNRDPSYDWAIIEKVLIQ